MVLDDIFRVKTKGAMCSRLTANTSVINCQSSIINREPLPDLPKCVAKMLRFVSNRHLYKAATQTDGN